MAGNTNFPTGLDDDTSLLDVTDGVSTLQAVHHNNMKEAIKALEAKVGIRNSAVASSLDYRLGHPTDGHVHNGASGQGPLISATALSGLERRFVQDIRLNGTAIVGSNVAPPVAIGRTAQIENISGALRRGASGATAAFNLRVGPTAIAVNFAPGATYASIATPAMTYPSGAMITLDVASVGSSDPGRDLSVVLVFRE